MPIGLTIKEYRIKQFHRMKRAELIHSGDFKAISASVQDGELVIAAVVGSARSSAEEVGQMVARKPAKNSDLTMMARQVFILTRDEVLPAELGIYDFVGTVNWTRGVSTITNNPVEVLFHIFVR